MVCCIGVLSFPYKRETCFHMRFLISLTSSSTQTFILAEILFLNWGRPHTESHTELLKSKTTF
uniref:Putative ovule protein n=1 Tax=Solanum chacoense TaxID=4108 RepID=A0A0V0HCI2_SOLCH